MSLFTADQIVALRELSGAWSGVKFCLIGATALGFHLDRSWRSTDDIDLTLSVELDSFPGAIAHLPGWTQHPSKEHEWHGPGNVQVDILPAGPGLLALGAIRWPRTGHKMSLVGMRLAFDTAKPHAIAEGPRCRFPPSQPSQC